MCVSYIIRLEPILVMHVCMYRGLSYAVLTSIASCFRTTTAFDLLSSLNFHTNKKLLARQSIQNFMVCELDVKHSFLRFAIVFFHHLSP